MNGDPGTDAGRRAVALTNRLGAVLATIALATGTALAHGGHGGHAAAGGGGGPNAALPVALLVGGVLVLGTSVYLDRTDQLDGRLADLGVLVGVVGLLAGATLGLF